MNFEWNGAITTALSNHSTPFYLCCWTPVASALDELNQVQGFLPLRHWLSFKTHPIAPLARKWRDRDLGVEVVSAFELLAVLSEGFDPSRILVNGVAKHEWLSACGTPSLRVHFDSIREVESLKVQARDQGWRVGFRFHVSEEYDPDEPAFSGQFGMSAREIESAMQQLLQIEVIPESIHFHLRGNVQSAAAYRVALEETAALCRSLEFRPRYVDFGGGLPAPGEWPADPGTRVEEFDLRTLREVYDQVPKLLPSVREIWLENGRFITARSSVLVMRVLDIKERNDSRYLICDGGRTNHALVSDWEAHDIYTIPDRNGQLIFTTICGPTCMAFDRLARKQLPSDISIGDHVVWMNAGAYHIPWETRFSHGLAKVLWYHEDGTIKVARDEEDFLDWWSRWK